MILVKILKNSYLTCYLLRFFYKFKLYYYEKKLFTNYDDGGFV